MQMTMQYLQYCKTLKNRKISSKKTVVESKFPAISLLNMFVFGKFTYILKKEMPLHLPILKTKFRCFFEKSSFLRGGALKDARFWKSHIYFERRDVPVLSYTKN